MRKYFKQKFKDLLFLIILLVLSGLTYSVDFSPTEIPVMPTVTGNFPKEFEQLLVLDSMVIAAPTVTEDYFLIRTEKSLYKYDSSLNLIWRVEYSGFPGTFSPTVCGDLIVVPIENMGAFVVVSSTDGSFRWGSATSEIANGHIEDVLCSEESIYVAIFSTGLYKYSGMNGLLVWKHDVPSRSSIYLFANNEGTEIYVVEGEKLLVYDSAVGTLLWEIDFKTFVGPAIKDHNKLVIVLGLPDNTEVAVINLSSRGIIWKEKTSGFFSDTLGGIVTDSGIIYLSGNKVIALSMAEGDKVWESEELGRLRRLVIYNDNIYARNDGNTLYEFNIKTGNIEAALSIGEEGGGNSFDRSPVAFHERLIVPFGDNRVFIYAP